MSGFGEYSTALRFRDVVRSVVAREVDASRPRYQYAGVKSIDRVNYKCTVRLPGETADVTVNMGSLQPSAIDQVVRVDGLASDRFIDDVKGPSVSIAEPIIATSDAVMNVTTPGAFAEGLGIRPTGTPDSSSGIYWYAAKNSAGQAAGLTPSDTAPMAEAGLFVRSRGAYGTRMYFTTTDNYTTGQKTAMSIAENGFVNFPRTEGIGIGGIQIRPNAGTAGNVYTALEIVNGSKSGYTGFRFTDEDLLLMLDGTGATGVYQGSTQVWKWDFDGSGILAAGTVPAASIRGGTISLPAGSISAASVGGGRIRSEEHTA